MGGCNLGQSEEEKQRIEENAHVNSVLDDSKQVFETNRNFIFSEIIFGSLCQKNIQKTGKVEGVDCETYEIAQEIAGELTDNGIILLIGLFKDGYLTLESPRYPEFEEIIQQLIVLTEEAHAIRLDIESYEGTDCTKCAM